MLSQPPHIFVEGTPRSHHTVLISDSMPEDAGDTILRIVGEALQSEGVKFQVTCFEAIPGDEQFPARVKFGIRLNGKDL